MVRAASSAALAAVSAAIAAIQVYYSLDLQPGAGTGTTTTTTTTASAAQASASVGDFQQIFLTLVAAAALYAATVLLYCRLRQAEGGAAAGGGDRRPSDLVAFISAAAGVLEFFLFVDDVGEVGVAAARVIPAASIATFFLGVVLIILSHIRTGGAVAGGFGAIQAPVWLVFVTKMAFAATAGLVVALMAIALCAN